jgi:hypothetical protein
MTGKKENNVWQRKTFNWKVQIEEQTAVVFKQKKKTTISKERRK